MNRHNEHDMTRKMLSTIRTDRMINENENALSQADNYEVNDNQLDNSQSDEEELTSAELSEQQNNFRSTVSPRVDFTGFKIYPKNKNVVFSGKFENMGGLEWEFTLEDANGLYISANNVPFSDDTIDTIKKLKGFYDNWADEWAEKLATEYNRDAGDGSAVQNSDVA